MSADLSPSASVAAPVEATKPEQAIVTWVRWARKNNKYRTPIVHRPGSVPGKTLCNLPMPLMESGLIEIVDFPPEFHRCRLCKAGVSWASAVTEQGFSRDGRKEREGN